MDKKINDQLLKSIEKTEMPLISAFTISMFTIYTLSVSCYSVIAPFMPIEIVKKEVDESVMGMIIGVFSLALILMAPFMGWIIERVGRRNPIIYGSFLLGFSFEMFAVIHYIEDKTLYVSLLFIFRIIQGIASVLIQVSCLSIVSTFYPSNREFLIGLLEALAGAGMMLGPLIGTGLFALGGYDFMLISFGGLFIVFAFLCPLVMPKVLDQYTRLDTTSHQSLENGQIEEEDRPVKVTALNLFMIPGYTLAAVAGLLGYFQVDFLNPILGLRLVALELNESQVGLFFCILAFSYIFGSIIATKLPKRIEKKVWIIFGLLASVPSQLLNGPSQIFGFPENSLFLIGLGQVLCGFADPLILVNVLPEMIDIVEQKFQELTEKQKAQLADFSSGLLTSVLGIGQISGPIFGALFNKEYGYRLTCDMVAIFCLVLCVLYVIFGNGISSFKKSFK